MRSFDNLFASGMAACYGTSYGAGYLDKLVCLPGTGKAIDS